MTLQSGGCNITSSSMRRIAGSEIESLKACGEKAVSQSGGLGPDAAMASAGWEGGEESMRGV